MKRRLLALALAFLLTMGQTAFAGTDTGAENLYDKGRAESTTVGTSSGKSTFVISAQAKFDMGCAASNFEWCTGREAIRVWGRNANVQSFYPNYKVEGLASANIRFMCDTTYSYTNDPAYENRCTNMMINSREPRTDATEITILSALWDILGAIGVQTNVLEAIANGLTGSIDVQEAHAWDETVVISAGLAQVMPASQTDLASSISYTQVDAVKDTIDSGLAAKWQYQLPRTNTNFKVWPQGQVTYLVQQASLGFFPVQSGAAGVIHTVNTQ